MFYLTVMSWDLLLSKYIYNLNFVKSVLFIYCNIINSYNLEQPCRQHQRYLLSNNSQLTEPNISIIRWTIRHVVENTYKYYHKLIISSKVTVHQYYRILGYWLLLYLIYKVYQIGGSAAISLSLLSLGPERKVKCYNGYFVNGYVYHTEEYGHGRKTYNNGICVKESTCSEFEVDYYGKLEEVVELQYHSEQNRVFLFKCYWYDTTDRGIRVDPHYGQVEINLKARLRNVNDVFVFAKQCQQVYYTYTPFFRKDWSRVDWLPILKMKPRGRVKVVQDENKDTSVRYEVFQVSELVEPYRVAPSIDLE